MKIFIIALAIAVLSGMGVGGGGLLVIYLTLFEGIEQHLSQGINLSFFLLAGAGATIYNAIKGRIVFKTTLILSACGVISSILGAIIANSINENFLQKIFGIMLLLSGTSSLITSFVQKKQNKNI
jgi:uncharacterized membrane protein YfcA